MDEPLSQLIPTLERRVRFWRATSFVLAGILLSGLVTSLFFWGFERQRALRARQAAMLEAVARQQAADLAVIEAERARQAAEEQKKD